MKDKLSIYFNTNDTVVWIDIIDKIIYNYNHSVNRGIGIEPYKVKDFIENMIIQDKLSPKYSNKIYTIIKVGKNTVSVMDDNEVVKVKKSNIKIISDVSNNTNLTELKTATLSNRKDRILKKEYIDESNIIEGKRERK